MSKLKTAKRLISDSDYRFLWLSERGYYNNMSDEAYLKRLFKIKLGYDLDLQNPKTFCEKLQWLKLYDRRPEYTMMADKYRVKEWVANKIGDKYVIPLYGAWDHFDEIDFDALPNQFVLKCNHDGGVLVCEDKSSFDFAFAKTHLEERLTKSYFWSGREWAYKDIPRKIIAEQYMPQLGKRDSIEYKITCFDGRVKLITKCTGIAHTSFDLRNNDNYDRDWNYLPFYAFYKNTGEVIEKPAYMDEVISICETLSKGIPQVRVDGYIIDDNWYFGEMTFYTWNGFIKFNPDEWDTIMGEWIKLPEKTINP